MMRISSQTPANLPLPKLCGGDIEFGNAILGSHSPYANGLGAGLTLLNEIAMDPANIALCPSLGTTYGRARAGWRGSSARGLPVTSSWERVWLGSTGGCWYLDHEHAEGCLPEVLDAFDHLAAWHVVRLQAGAALRRANARLGERGQRLVILANNSDGEGNSYGGHLNVLLSRRAFDDLFDRRLHHLLFLAAYQVSSILFTGQGKVGAENGAPGCDYQIAQRADFIETLVGPQTTERRPLVNSRREALCGSEWRDGRDDPAFVPRARLHVIFFDTALCDRSALLRVGVLQILLAMIEAGEVDLGLLLDDPVRAVRGWSHDPDLRAVQRLASGERLTALEHQILFLERARAFVERGGCEGIVPRAAEIVAFWDDTLQKFERRDLDSLASGIDWVLKRSMLERALDETPGLDWTSPEMKHLDHLYSSLDDDGLFAAVRGAGGVEEIVDPARVEQLLAQPPEETRAWTRALLLRRAVEEDARVFSVDWDRLAVRVRASGRTREHWIDLGDPLGFTRRAVVPVASRPFEELLDILGSATTEWRGGIAASPHVGYSRGGQDGVAPQPFDWRDAGERN